MKLIILGFNEGSTLSLFSTQDLGLECNNEFQDLGPELNIAFRTQVLNAIMVSQDPGIWDLGPECINGYFAPECTQSPGLEHNNAQ